MLYPVAQLVAITGFVVRLKHAAPVPRHQDAGVAGVVDVRRQVRLPRLVLRRPLVQLFLLPPHVKRLPPRVEGAHRVPVLHPLLPVPSSPVVQPVAVHVVGPPLVPDRVRRRVVLLLLR